ncbi:MAG TPA: ribonuclease J [Candidatus Caccousia avistercoris]|nr:ribonuclease J [Candidatus Caccousia avistercoris]
MPLWRDGGFSLSDENSIGLYGKIEVKKPADQEIGGNAVSLAAAQSAADGHGEGEAPKEQRPRRPRRRPQQQKAEGKQAKAPKAAAAKKQEPAARAAQKPAGQKAPRAAAEKPAQAQRPARGRRRAEPAKPPVRVYFLGGLNEIGKNFTLYECGEDMVIVDCGMAFPDGDMLGVDLVLPDFTFVERNAEKIRGIVITHGHEDHIGALPYLLKRVNLPVYATRLTVGLIEGKLREHGLLGKAKLHVTSPGETVKLGCMEVEFIHVNHSIPDAVAFAIHTPAGVLVHTGDFKIDCTPAQGEMIDLGRLAQLGKEGVLALLADSTNAERPGYTMTEQKVNDSFESLFRRAENSRLIIATFASNISRVQQIINCAVRYGRKVALSGRSMLNVMGIAMEMGYLEVPDGVLIDIDMISRYPKEQIVLVTTGSQGEPMSALARMAFADHRKVEVGPGDFIIISARPIPGNEKTVGNVVDELMKRGCQVVYESMYEVHVSGHACQGELKIMQGIVHPKYFIPVHGEQKMLQKHAGLARAMGMPDSRIYIGDIGDVLEISESGMKKVGTVPAGRVLVDGLGVGDVGSIVLRDRKHLGEDGLIVVVCTISSETGHVVAGPDVVSRGFVYVRESEPLIDDARALVNRILDGCADSGVRDWGTLKTKVKDGLSRLLYDKTRRSPMILPIIMEV